MPYGLLCEADAGASFQPGRWYEVQGTLSTTSSGYRLMPVVKVQEYSADEAVPHEETLDEEMYPER